VYAGADGNAYKHTDNGWSKWANGGWQPVQPPTNPRTSTPSTTRPTHSSSNYQQLEQDRFAASRGARPAGRQLLQRH
jgi:hypothetical protein